MTIPPSAPPRPPAGTFVLRRAAHLERRVNTALTVQIVLQIVVMAVVLAGGFLFVALATMTTDVFLIPLAGVVLALGGTVFSLAQALRWRRTERRMRGVELWLSPGGVAYTGGGGYFPAPWAAVRGIRFQGRPAGYGRRAEALYVDVDGWGGPLAAYATGGKPCSLRMPLAGCGADRATIARAVAAMTRGGVTVAGA